MRGFARDSPYNDLPPLPPNGELETKAVLKAVIGAREALGELRKASSAIPNQGVLVRAIALQEARLSSEIENIVTTNDVLYRALSQADVTTDPHAKEVLRYGNALWAGLGVLGAGKAFGIELFESLAGEVLGEPTGIRLGAGTRVGNPRTGQVLYTPPEGTKVLASLLDNLAIYMNGPAEVDPLVKLAVAHYQFEAIHPFRDGNGRVGRILNVLYLVREDFLEQPILYLSRAILDDRSAYYRGLREVTESQDWESWVLFMLDVIRATAEETKRRVEIIRRGLGEADRLAREGMRKGYSHRLIELVFEQPYTRIPFLERARIAKRQTASEYLQDLARLGVLRAERRGREVYFVNDRLLEALSF